MRVPPRGGAGVRGRRRGVRVRRRLLVQPVPPSRPSAQSARRLDDAGYFAVADRLVSARSTRSGTPALQPLRAGPGRRDHRGQRQPAARPLASPRCAGITGPRAPTSAPAPLARFLVGPEIWTDAPPAGADPQVTGPGWRGGARLPVPPHGLRHRGRRRPRPRLPRARRARARRADVVDAHPRRDPRASPRAPTGAGPRCGSTSSTGTARCSPPTRSSTARGTALADGHGAPPRALPRGAAARRGAELRRRAALPLPAAPPARAPARTSTRPSTRTSC